MSLPQVVWVVLSFLPAFGTDIPYPDNRHEVFTEKMKCERAADDRRQLTENQDLKFVCMPFWVQRGK